jgi:hypothetical protein
MQTVAEFMPVFFRELIVDGQIDRAMAAARSAVRDRPDGWMPVLYLRFSDGKIWYTPGFGGEKDQEFKKMASLTRAIKERTCTALIGQGMVETLIGSRRDIALRWADEHKYPLSPYDREDFPRVAQYIVTELDPDYLTGALRDALRLTITEYYPDRVGRELLEAGSWDPAQLQRAMELVSEAHWNPENPGPYQYLAQLRLPIYINTNYGDLLATALRKAGANPVSRLAPWNSAIPEERWQYDGEPTPDQPLIYHLFGHYDEPASLVLAEDDYFDYLINMTRYSDKVPKRVRSALSSTALIFLGFRLDDWAFRVLFRLIWGQAGSSMLQRKSHAAVQIEPDEGRIVDAGRARSYLMDYFQKGHVTLYWGGAEDFLRELIANL